MTAFTQKKYFLDNIPVSAQELIQAAENIDEDFAWAQLQSTSQAANILRKAGHVVDTRLTKGAPL